MDGARAAVDRRWDSAGTVVEPVAQSGHGAAASAKSRLTVADSRGGKPIPAPDTVAPVAPIAAWRTVPAKWSWPVRGSSMASTLTAWAASTRTDRNASRPT